MASLYPKKISGKTYWYLREMARVDGKPKMISERYLGPGAGSPVLLGSDARRHPGAAGRDLPDDRGADRGSLRGGLLVGGAGHDQLRHVHRDREWESAGRAAGQGQAETF